MVSGESCVVDKGSRAETERANTKVAKRLCVPIAIGIAPLREY